MILKDLNLCIVDIETTGTKVIEVAVIKIEKGKLVDQYHTLLNPEQPIPFSITELTGISDDDVKDAPIFQDIHKKLWDFLKGSVFVAHNVSFDYGFLRREFSRQGLPFNLERFCSVNLSRLLFADEAKHDLSSIVDRYNIVLSKRHRALDDALGVWEFLKIIQKKINKKDQEDALSRVLRCSTFFPNKLKLNIDHVPYGLGVYMFYDLSNTLLYVGKANDMRSRVWDQLSDDKRLSKEVARIEYVETYGKLSAALIELHLIKQREPVYNRRFKPLEKMTILSIVEDNAGFKNIHLETYKEIRKEDLTNAYMVFRTKKDATAFVEGISKKIRLGSNDQPVIHNMRLIESLSKRRKITWPYKGPVMIEESSPLKTHGEAFVIDQWIVEEAFKYESEAKIKLYETNGRFDFDTYRILYNYLLKNDNAVVL